MYYYIGAGATGMGGTDPDTYLSSYRTVFLINARLKVGKLTSTGAVNTAMTPTRGSAGKYVDIPTDR